MPLAESPNKKGIEPKDAQRVPAKGRKERTPADTHSLGVSRSNSFPFKKFGGFRWKQLLTNTIKFNF